MLSNRNAKAPLFAAKISRYQFDKVLWHFVLDHSARETARHLRVTENSISAIHARLRGFFFDVRLFTDPYRGNDPEQGMPGRDAPDELALLDFHMKRVRAKRGRLNTPPGKPDHHLAESHWRYGFEPFRNEVRAQHVERLMFENLQSFIRRFGPVGSPRALTLAQRLDSARLVLEQLDQRLIWLERNALRYRTPELREELRDIRRS